MFQIKFNYCVQCKQIDKENIYNCRWLNLNFCCLLCLQQFFDQIALKCDICNKQLNYNRIHLRDDLKNNKLFTFVCDECFVQRNPLAVKCHYCASKCYKGFGTFDLTTSGVISKYVCSNECRIMSLTKHDKRNKIELTSCSECDIRRPCVQAIENGKFRLICSMKCLDAIEKNLATKFGLFFIRFYFGFSKKKCSSNIQSQWKITLNLFSFDCVFFFRFLREL